MDYRRIGRSGLRVSELCLGTMTFGQATDEAEADRILGAALDAGVTFIDTANKYAEGSSETILGRLLRGRRDRVVLATKFANRTGPGPKDAGWSRVHVLRAVEESLSRLRTDHIDLYYLHHVDPDTPPEEVLSTLDALVRAGKIRHVAASNFEGWRLLDTLWRAEVGGWEPIVGYQPQYNLLVRDIEEEILPICRLRGVGVIPWAPLAGGLLTGKYGTGVAPRAGSRSEDGWAFRDRIGFLHPDRELIVATLIETAREIGRAPAAVAIRWLLERPEVTSAIIGVREADQLAANLEAVGWRLDPEHAARLEAVSRPLPRYPRAFEERAIARRAPPTPPATLAPAAVAG